MSASLRVCLHDRTPPDTRQAEPAANRTRHEGLVSRSTDIPTDDAREPRSVRRDRRPLRGKTGGERPPAPEAGGRTLVVGAVSGGQLIALARRRRRQDVLVQPEAVLRVVLGL